MIGSVVGLLPRSAGGVDDVSHVDCRSVGVGGFGHGTDGQRLPARTGNGNIADVNRIGGDGYVVVIDDRHGPLLPPAVVMGGAEIIAVGGVLSATITVNVADDAIFPSPFTSFTTPAATDIGVNAAVGNAPPADRRRDGIQRGHGIAAAGDIRQRHRGRDAIGAANGEVGRGNRGGVDGRHGVGVEDGHDLCRIGDVISGARICAVGNAPGMTTLNVWEVARTALPEVSLTCAARRETV